MKRLIYFLLAALIILLLSACGTVDKISKKAGANEVFLLSKSGDIVLVDTEKGKVVPSCESNDRKGFEDCKIPFDLNSLKENVDELKEELEKNCKVKDCKPGFVKNVKTLLIIDHPGSTCRTIYDRATGNIYQICR